MCNAVFAEVVSTAAEKMWPSEDEKADAALCLHQDWGCGHKLAIIAVKLVVFWLPDRCEADER